VATSLPNERALFLRLDADLARCQRNHGVLAVLVCDGEAAQRPRGPAPCGQLPWDCAVSARRRLRGANGGPVCAGAGQLCGAPLGRKTKRIEALMAELSSGVSGERPAAVKVGAAYYPEDGGYAEDLLAVADARMNQLSQDREGTAESKPTMKRRGELSRPAIVLAHGAPAAAVPGPDDRSCGFPWRPALVRLSPGFGLDESRLDSRLSDSSIRAIEAENEGKY